MLSPNVSPQPVGDPSLQRPLQRLAAPGLLDATFVRVQVGAPAGGSTGRVRLDIAISGADQAHQRVLGPFLPAADAGADRRSRRHSDWESPLMSTRQPVNLAASRAF